ncbi:MAG: hypothetical protein AAGK32_13700, partial [Actinomycetota bacterium]
MTDVITPPAGSLVDVQPREEGNDQRRGRPNHSPIGGGVTFVFLALVAVAAALFGFETYGELTSAVGADTYVPNVDVFGLDFSPQPSQLVVLVGASGGALGAVAAGAWAAAVHFANRRFGAAWIPWYFVRILLGAVLGGMVMLAIAAGLITGGTAEVAPAGAAVTGFIVGLAAKETMDKFEQLIDVLFGKGENRADGLTAQLREVRRLQRDELITAEQAEARIAKILEG